MASKKTNIFSDWHLAISYVLENRGLSQKYIVENLGKSYSQVSKWVRGLVFPNKETRNKIEFLLDISLVKNNQGKWELTQQYSPESLDDQIARVEDQVKEYESTAQRLASSGVTSAGLSPAVHLEMLRSAQQLIGSYIKIVEADLQHRLNQQKHQNQSDS